jgi:hypothetical protein
MAGGGGQLFDAVKVLSRLAVGAGAGVGADVVFSAAVL